VCGSLGRFCMCSFIRTLSLIALLSQSSFPLFLIDRSRRYHTDFRHVSDHNNLSQSIGCWSRRSSPSSCGTNTLISSRRGCVYCNLTPICNLSTRSALHCSFATTVAGTEKVKSLTLPLIFFKSFLFFFLFPFSPLVTTRKNWNEQYVMQLSVDKSR